MLYKTSLDNLAKGITISVTVLFALIIAGQFALIKFDGLAIPVLTTAILLAIYFLAFVFRPVSCTVTQDELIIKRPFMSVKINRSKIAAVVQVNKEKLSGSIRTFGVGGLFGYYGKFINRTLGSMTWYVTRRDKTVLIKTIDGHNIILSPDESEKFVAEFNRP